MNAKKILSLLLACALLVMLVSCSSAPAEPSAPAEDSAPVTDPAVTEDIQTEEPADAPVDEPAEAPAETPAETPAEVSVFDENGRIVGGTLVNEHVTFPLAETKTYRYFIGTMIPVVWNYLETLNEGQFYSALEEKTNIVFEFETPGASQGERFALMMASDDIAHCIRSFNQFYTNGVDHAIEEGVIWALEDYAEYYPNYNAIRNSVDSLKIDTVSDEGHTWGFACVLTEEQRSWWGPVVRSDLLEKYNLDAPVTYDDWETMFEAFMQEPGMDIGPFMPSATGFSIHNAWTGAFNCGNLYSFNNVDGTVQFSVLSDGYKEAVELMNKWWEKGYIYRDFLSVGYGNNDMIINGQVGVWEQTYDLSTYKMQFDPANN